jgi:Glucose / Sorbosone dehydrogenase
MRLSCVRGWIWLTSHCLMVASFSCMSIGAALAAEEKWQDDWAVAPGFSLTVDTAGFRFPTSIVFVPDPGGGPKDPLYFVAEVRGTIKVVTNDRTVHTFADDFISSVPPEELPEAAGAVGLFGLCLAPEKGYVYGTFAAQAEDGLFTNKMIRFDTTPHTFAIQPESQAEFSTILSSPQSRFGTPFGHQVGSCQVHGDHVFVGVGDGELTHKAQDLNSTLGKILRMTLDGTPVPGNPFYSDDGITGDNDFVWTQGLRNPFGDVIVDGRVFVADNGPVADRFLQVSEGDNFLYDGSDESIATNSIVVFQDGRGLGHVVYKKGPADFLPDRFWSSFFLVLSGAPQVLIERKRPEIVALKYDLDQNLLLRRPETLVRYEGSERQALAGIALGPDGLYFAPVLPDGSPTTAVYKLRYAPGSQHPVVLETDLRSDVLMREFGCLGCHELGGKGVSRAPALDATDLVERIEERLESADYAEQVRALDARDAREEAPFRQWAAARQEVLDAEGRDKLRTWLTYRIMEPRFDDPNATMPNLGLSKREAAKIAGGLLKEEPGALSMVDNLLPEPTKQYLIYFFAAGVVGGGMLGTGFAILWSMVRRRRRLGRD